jgi:hypothetical protein
MNHAASYATDGGGGGADSSSGFDTSAMPDRFSDGGSKDYSSFGSRNHGGGQSKPLGDGLSTGVRREFSAYLDTIVEWADASIERLERSVRDFDCISEHKSEIEKAKQVAAAVALFGFATVGLFAAASATPVVAFGAGLTFAYTGANLGVTLSTSTAEAQKWLDANYDALFNVYGLQLFLMQQLSGQSVKKSLDRSSNVAKGINGYKNGKTVLDSRSSAYKRTEALTKMDIALQAESRDYRRDMCSDEYRLGPRLP